MHPTSLLLAVLASILTPGALCADVSMEWVVVTHAGNGYDASYFGNIDHQYRIGRFEVTNAEYAEFLNAVAATDSHGLYNPEMGVSTDTPPSIVRTGSPGEYAYATIPGRERRPVNFVSYWDSLRFANWMHNGQPEGAQTATTTEDGAYTITTEAIASGHAPRNPNATHFLPSHDEWYKAAYFDSSTMTEYFGFPQATDDPPLCSAPSTAPATANCQGVVNDLTEVGSYVGSASPMGTFDQGGNVQEWIESQPSGGLLTRGGNFANERFAQHASYAVPVFPGPEESYVGFRLAATGPPVPPPPIRTVVIETVVVGRTGNPCDDSSWSNCFGGVLDHYAIGRFEITNDQYAQFLNAVASAADPNLLYDSSMAGGYVTLGGITRSTWNEGFSYAPVLGREEMPVTYVSHWDAIRFTNWLHNGQPRGDQAPSTTEDGAYSITPDAVANGFVVRNPGATYWLPDEDEWYKAAYYDMSGADIYYEYPTGSDTVPTCGPPGPEPRKANCLGAVYHHTDVGSYPGSPSPSGTFDQAGNVTEWLETPVPGSAVIRGGAYGDDIPMYMAKSGRSMRSRDSQESWIGFRVAGRPLPTTLPALHTLGLLGLSVVLASSGLLATLRHRKNL